MVIRPGDPNWERLNAVWNAQRRPEIINANGAHYRVFTPNGEDAPIFSGVEDQTLYSHTSSGFAKSPEPTTVKAPSANQEAPKISKRRGGK